jgi:hypothetical protein
MTRSLAYTDGRSEVSQRIVMHKTCYYFIDVEKQEAPTA